MRLKGQNFRIRMLNTTDDKYYCIGMATSCTVNLNTNTDQGETKDTVGSASQPEIMSNSWSVSVESLNVVDAGALLTAIKSMQPVSIMWDETLTTDNQLMGDAAYARVGQAYISDVTLNFNDRENSVKSIQFTGTGALDKVDGEAEGLNDPGSFTKGQFVRLYLSNAANPALVVAGAKSLSLHVSLSMEDATTKDTEGTWQVQEPTGITYDISSSALVASNETITSQVGGQSLATLMDYYEANTLMYWQIANASGANQRTKGSVIASGRAYITSLTVNAANRQVATYDTQLSGYGEYGVAA